MEVNKLILGDNLEILKSIESESVDLIYLDPPFFSNRNYEIIWGDKGEVRSFEDRWAGGVENYIAWLKERVVQMHRVLKDTGSIFLHCDWHASHYIKVDILDKIFGYGNMRNEIIWCYKRPSAPKQKQLSRVHDTIFWYTKSDSQWIFNSDKIKIPYAESSINRAGFAANKSKMTDGGVVELKEGGKMPEDWWEVFVLKGNSKEWIGYPTQKPEKLLDRIIEMASNEGDVVLDPFLGGGTTVAVADKLNRRWIGIDQSVQAIKVSELRLDKQRGLFSMPFVVQLHKYDFDSLRYSNAFEFESWIVMQYGGISNTKQRCDFGIDGKMHDNTPIQVKRSDNIGRNVIDNFDAACRRYDKNLYNLNIENKKTVGIIIAFSFGKGAVEEVARLRNKENAIIKLIRVDEIVEVATKPRLTIGYNVLTCDDKGSCEIEFDATATSESGIVFYSWDFNYNLDGGFKAQIMIDTQGKQRYKFKAGSYNIAVKAVDNDGLESIEVIRLKVNGVVSSIMD
jgi:DNA modification methylase